MEVSGQQSAAPATFAELLRVATAQLASAGVDSPALTAEILLAAACGLERTQLHVRPDQVMPAAAHGRFAALLARRLKREPLQYIVGSQEFWSLDFVVTPDVLIPRPETELLVELVLKCVGVEAIPITICDLGTGSGCIAVALAREIPEAEIWALDASAAALEVAEGNAKRHGVSRRAHFVHSNLFDAIAEQRFDVIVSNPPYVATADISAQPELAYEPRLALDGGADGLDCIRKLLPLVPRHLVDGGWLFMEIGADEGEMVLSLAQQGGAGEARIEPDYAGLPRALVARW